MVHDALNGVPDGEWVVVDAPDDWRTLSPVGPGGRPMARWRPLFALAAVAALVGLVFVMLSDRAPGILGEVSEQVVVRVDARVPEARSTFSDAVSTTYVAEKDVQAHVGLWAIVMFLLGLVSWSWRSLAAMTVLVLAAATTLEYLQESLAPTRITEQSDFIANAVGVAIGLVAVVIVTAAMSVPSRVRRRE